jgi:CubicO group peptidase (beta-lactamase class C family)
MADQHIPGLGLALADESGVVWAGRFGCANRKKGIPFTADTRSNIASVSKLFLCASLMKLVEEGKVALDQPLSTFLP